MIILGTLVILLYIFYGGITFNLCQRIDKEPLGFVLWLASLVLPLAIIAQIGALHV